MLMDLAVDGYAVQQLEEFAGTAGRKGGHEALWELFGKRIRLGFHEDFTNRTKVAELLRFRSSKSGDVQFLLRGHVVRMEVGRRDVF